MPTKKRFCFVMRNDSTSCLSRPLKKTHMLRCAQSIRFNVPPEYVSAYRSFARLASDIFLSSLQDTFYHTFSFGR